MDSVWKSGISAKGRCINIDWLECYCIESVESFPHNAAFFRDNGWTVLERDYGTRQYREMFTLLDNDNLPFIEVRRNPVAGSMDERTKGIFSEFSCHIRLSNRYCYHNEAVNLYSEFLSRYDYTVQRIFRLDLALDFEKFDSGDDPHAFMQRYMAGRYSKINQGNLSGHAKDKWENRDWNSCSWGSPKSMVSTKLYDKTLELREAKDKPYIRYAWFTAGLISDWQNVTKVGEDGKVYAPSIWRVEFSIRSSARSWYVIEDESTHKTKTIAQEHTLGTYATKEQQLHAFALLAHHYFHFKHYEAGVRKDRCKDKVLFRFNLNHRPYKLDTLLSDNRPPAEIDQLKARLERYRMLHVDPSVCHACDVILQTLSLESVRYALPSFGTVTEAELLQRLIALRMKEDPKKPLSEDMETVKAMLDLENEVF